MSATAGKVALVRTAGLLSGACPSGADLADLIGFGAASCAETSPTAQLSNTTAALRLQGGTTDTDDNSADFVILGPTPRNSAVITTAPAADVVISQVYGGGGNSGAELKNDFIELRNRELFDISVAGWTVQYTSAAGSAWAATALNGTIPAGGYYLVQEAAGSGGSLSLPAPDAAGNIAMSATSGKVALVAGATPLTGTCPLSGVLDFVGYGAASCFEGSGPTPTLSNTTAAIRHDGGLVDTNDNAADFLAGVPSPKSTVGVPPTAIGAAVPPSIASGTSTLLTLKVTPGAFPPGPVAAVNVDLSTIGGGTQAFFDDGTNGDITAGDNIYSFQVVATGAPGFKVLTGSITDVRGRLGTASIRLAIEPSTPTPISQIQGSGSTSPVVGQFVTTAGIVTALRSSGFYVQTPDGLDDLDPSTSEGLFVFTSGATVKPAVGDEVRVSGIVSEFAPAPPSPPVTELGGGPLFSVIGSMQPLPLPIVLHPSDTSPTGPLEQLEKYRRYARPGRPERHRADRRHGIRVGRHVLFQRSVLRRRRRSAPSRARAGARPRLTGAGRAALLRATLRWQPRTASRRQQRAAWQRDPERRRGAADIRCDRCSGLCVRQLRDPARSRHGRRDRGAGSDAGSSRERNGIHGGLRESRAVLRRAGRPESRRRRADAGRGEPAPAEGVVDDPARPSLTRHSRRRRSREPFHPAEARCKDQRRCTGRGGKRPDVRRVPRGRERHRRHRLRIPGQVRACQRDQRGADRQGCDVHAARAGARGPASAPERSAATRAESGSHGPPGDALRCHGRSSITSARSAGSTARTEIASVQNGRRRRNSSRR